MEGMPGRGRQKSGALAHQPALGGSVSRSNSHFEGMTHAEVARARGRSRFTGSPFREKLRVPVNTGRGVRKFRAASQQPALARSLHKA